MIENFETPNLDAMSQEELSDFSLELERLIHDLKILVSYSLLKRRAMRERLAGHIEAALSAEQRLESIYQDIPERFKW